MSEAAAKEHEEFTGVSVFLGERVAYWVNVRRVLRKYDVADVEDLEARLEYHRLKTQ